MAVKINQEECVVCGACASECPQEVLTVEDTCVVDEAACIDCGICIEECPTGAISA